MFTHRYADLKEELVTNFMDVFLDDEQMEQFQQLCK
jgi:hypothetical protein